jgi:selenium-dependent xanthine dehydrogenase
MPEVYTITVNGVVHEVTEEKPLLRYLRDDLGLMSVKDGCSEGACGTCTVVIDGKATKCCTMSTKRADGKTVITCEGLTEQEKEAFVYAFGLKGSVQCGFCIPGMVMSGKALIDANPNPTEEDIKKGIKGNICRCTGYKKIIEGIAFAAAILRGDEQIDPNFEKGEGFGVGKPSFRLDAREKTLGTGVYPDDIYEEGMLHASAVRTEYPRARVVKIDTTEAEAMPGVAAIYRAEDVPVNKVGHLQQDWDVMIAEGDITRCMGDAIVLVVADTLDHLEAAKKAVHIEYEPLEPVRNVWEAQAEGAPKVHSNGNLCQQRHIVRGDAKAALEKSAYTVTESFSTPFTEHAFLEPECAVAYPLENGGVKLMTTDQGVYDTRHEVTHMFGWDDCPEKVIVENTYVGGGFGGKEDVSIQHLAALAAVKLQKIVKIKMSRQESINFHPKRHAMEATFTVGCDKDGILTGLDCDVYFDTGAYASLAGPVLERACTHAPGPYCYQNTEIRGYSYYTNNPPAGAFRGFGVCQTQFALENCLNLLAEKVGISPWEIRYRNAIEPGKVLPNGQIADCSTALKETLEAVKDVYEANASHAGIACAMKNAGVGVGIPDKGRARMRVRNGVVETFCAASDIGQGCKTIFAQMAVESTGLPLEKIKMMPVSTELGPDSGTTSGSRQTTISGEAVRMVGLDVKKALEEVGGDLSKLEGQEWYEEFFDPTDKLGADVPFPKSHVCYGFATSVVILDEETQLVTDIYQAHDSGTVVNPIAIQGQIEGGVLMSMGYGLQEKFPLVDCVPKVKYGTLGLFRADKIPHIHATYVEKDEQNPFSYGAKGVGEITSIPCAQAIAGAYYAMDGKLRTTLPMEDTPYNKKKPVKK